MSDRNSAPSPKNNSFYNLMTGEITNLRELLLCRIFVVVKFSWLYHISLRQSTNKLLFFVLCLIISIHIMVLFIFFRSSKCPQLCCRHRFYLGLLFNRISFPVLASKALCPNPLGVPKCFTRQVAWVLSHLWRVSCGGLQLRRVQFTFRIQKQSDQCSVFGW